MQASGITDVLNHSNPISTIRGHNTDTIVSVDSLVPYNMERRRIRQGFSLDDRCVGNDHGAKGRSGSVQRDHDSGRHLNKGESDIFVGVIWQSRNLRIRAIFEVGSIQMSWIGFRLWAYEWWQTRRSSCIIVPTWVKVRVTVRVRRSYENTLLASMIRWYDRLVPM
jgi:hypothetical protein